MTGSESELWARARARDGRAFAELFDLHRDRVFRHTLRLVDNAHDAEEVVGAAFFELWRKSARVVPVEGSVLPWLLVCASRISRNVTRGTRRYRTLFDSLPRSVERADDPAELAEAATESTVIALQTLRELDASLLTLVAVEGYTITEAATVLGLSDGAARTRLHRAKRKLRERLQHDPRFREEPA